MHEMGWMARRRGRGGIQNRRKKSTGEGLSSRLCSACKQDGFRGATVALTQTPTGDDSPADMLAMVNSESLSEMETAGSKVTGLTAEPVNRKSTTTAV